MFFDKEGFLRYLALLLLPQTLITPKSKQFTYYNELSTKKVEIIRSNHEFT